MTLGRRLLVPLAGGILAAVVFPAVVLAQPRADPPPQPSTQTEAYCLSCHGEEGLSLTLPNGESLSLTLSEETLRASVHSPLGIECRACHTEITTYPHPAIEYATRRELARNLYLACQKCHADNYDKTLDSMHAQVAAAGNLDAPVCTDCHGAHDVHPPDEPRAHISEICGQCHTEMYASYAESVHGAALIQEGNTDVPVCTDCHGVHNIGDPRTAQFRVDTPEMCAGCHADPELMARYGLSADVYSLYNLSFHGVDISVYKANWPTIWHQSAVCTDCHGIHDIRRTGDPRSRVNPANLLTTCQQCHPEAGPNWTGAWTGHNRVSLERTPFVFYTQAFYSQLVPFVLVLSAIYVGLQILRATVDRIRRALR
ncbi:MAG TPA: cytochrome c3 family protein [Anaerolineales bacterium]|nr:cytochrome c3 family protein [Anaerolineales bacterium]